MKDCLGTPSAIGCGTVLESISDRVSRPTNATTTHRDNKRMPTRCNYMPAICMGMAKKPYGGKFIVCKFSFPRGGKLIELTIRLVKRGREGCQSVLIDRLF